MQTRSFQTRPKARGSTPPSDAVLQNLWWLESVDRGRVRFNRFMRSQRYWTWCAKEITEVFVVGGTKPDEYVLCVGSGDGGIMSIKGGLPSPKKKWVYSVSSSFATSYFCERGTSSHCSVCDPSCSSSYGNHDGISRSHRLPSGDKQPEIRGLRLCSACQRLFARDVVSAGQILTSALREIVGIGVLYPPTRGEAELDEIALKVYM